MLFKVDLTLLCTCTDTYFAMYPTAFSKMSLVLVIVPLAAHTHVATYSSFAKCQWTSIEHTWPESGLITLSISHRNGQNFVWLHCQVYTQMATILFHFIVNFIHKWPEPCCYMAITRSNNFQPQHYTSIKTSAATYIHKGKCSYRLSWIAIPEHGVLQPDLMYTVT